MKETEHQNLNQWIAINVFGLEVGFDEVLTVEPDKNGEPNIVDHKPIPHYTTDPAAAMMVLEKCAEKSTVMVYKSCGGRWVACDDYNDPDILVDSETLPLAICLFAKKLFEKGNQ